MDWYAVWRGSKSNRSKDTCLQSMSSINMNNCATPNNEHNREDLCI